MRKAAAGLVFLSILLFSLPLYGEDCTKARAYFEQARQLGGGPFHLIEKEQLYQRAIELCPSSAESHNNLGVTCEEQGRFEEAIVHYRKAIALKPSFSDPYVGLGDIYFKTNRPVEAIHWYEEGLKRDPNDIITQQRLALLKDVKEGGVIRAETIRGVLSAGTRGPAEVVSLTLGEGLIPFDFDKYDIRPDAQPQLNEIGKALKGLFGRNKDIAVVGADPPELTAKSVIEVGGHTDVRGPDSYNLWLSQKRVESVVKYLAIHFDIPRERLLPQGRGERVPLCTGSDSEACHALNRRVELIRHPSSQAKGMRSGSARGEADRKIKLEMGFFYRRKESSTVGMIQDEKTGLRSRSDCYFIFFRPLQDGYVYILQEDGAGRGYLLFPERGGEASVEAGHDYWVPSSGNCRTLDDTRGEEKLYLVAASQPLKSAIEGLSLEELVRGAIRGLETRYIGVVPPLGAPETGSVEDPHDRPQKIKELLERVEGEGGWVRTVRFRHE